MRVCVCMYSVYARVSFLSHGDFKQARLTARIMCTNKWAHIKKICGAKRSRTEADKRKDGTKGRFVFVFVTGIDIFLCDYDDMMTVYNGITTAHIGWLTFRVRLICDNVGKICT